jgi:hypothetical protein
MRLRVAVCIVAGADTYRRRRFLIKAGKDSEFVHPADAVTVASVIQQKNSPRPPSNNGSAVYTSENVG